jgi:hypothetical protein
MISVNTNLHIVRVSALYDLIVTAGFMMPWTAFLVFKGFALLSEALALDRAVPTLDITAMLFANLLGSVVVVWSIYRLMQPSRGIGIYDAMARMLFAVWQLFAVAQGASYLILGFTCFEVAFAIAQLMPVTDPLRARTNTTAKRSGLGAR